MQRFYHGIIDEVENLSIYLLTLRDMLTVVQLPAC